MEVFSVNILAVLSCVVISMASGALWYNPKTFFPVWWKGIGKTEADRPGPAGMSMALMWTLTVLASLVEALFLAVVVNLTDGLLSGGVTPLSGVLTGFFLWLGIIAPTYLVNKLFAGHSLKIWAIETGNHLLNFLLFGLVLGLWR